MYTHKLGALCFSLGNVRPHLRSTLKSIFVLAIGKTDDIKTYGMDTFLSPFVDEINVVDSQHYCFHGALIFFGGQPSSTFSWRLQGKLLFC